MKKKAGFTIGILTIALVLFSLTACRDTMDEPEIGVDYLKGEFAQQLEDDGAEIITGSVDIVQTEKGYVARIAEKEMVPSKKYDAGYYLAETNNLYERIIGSDCRMVYLENDQEVVGSSEGFAKNHNGNPEQMYRIYCFVDSCELILPIYPEEELDL